MLWSDELKTDSDSGEMWLKLHVHVRNKRNDSMSEIKNKGRVAIILFCPN